MRLGARIVKTGVAVVLAYYVSAWFDLNPPLLVVIAAILTTQPSIYLSLKYFLDQLQANAVGAIVSVTAAYAIGTEPIGIGLVVIVVIIINLFLKLESSMSLSILTVVAVMAEPTGALNRFLLIMIGIVLAILVNAVFLPPNPEKQLMEKLRSLHERMLVLLRNVIEGQWKEASLMREKKQLAAEMKKAWQLYDTYKEERNIRIKSRRQKAYKLVIYKNMLDMLAFELRLINSIRKDIDDDRMIVAEDAILQLAHDHELCVMKYEGKVKAKPRNEAKFERFGVEMLQYAGDRIDSSWIMFVGRLMELEERLNHLDRLVTSYVRRYDRHS